MGNIVPFRRIKRPRTPHRPRRRWRSPRRSSMMIVALALVAVFGVFAQLAGSDSGNNVWTSAQNNAPTPPEDIVRVIRYGRDDLGPAGTIACTHPRIIDGDTLECGGTRIRLAGIDAPEMPGHCRRGRDCVAGDPYEATGALRELASGGVSCTPQGTDIYGRTIARCTASGRDLSCAMVSTGHAVERYGGVNC